MAFCKMGLVVGCSWTSIVIGDQVPELQMVVAGGVEIFNLHGFVRKKLTKVRTWAKMGVALVWKCLSVGVVVVQELYPKWDVVGYILATC